MSDERRDRLVADLSATIDELLRHVETVDEIAAALPLGRPSDLTRLDALRRRTSLLLSQTLVLLDRLDPDVLAALQAQRAATISG